MSAIISILIILLTIILIIAVLLQPGKGDLSATFGGISSQMGAMFGMQRTVTMLAKITKVIAIIILLLTIAINKFFISHEENELKPVTQGAEIPASKTLPPTEVPTESK